jgi:flagellar P-ring protein precursor FlgI
MNTLNTLITWARCVGIAVTVWIGCLALAFMPALALAERVKDISQVQGVRGNQLVGYGLVVGLDSSGDQVTQTPFTVQSIKSMLAQLGVNVPSNINPQTKNVAAVMVHAELPPFAKPGQTIDVTVSSMGNAKSLRGGALLMTPLKGINGEIYAIAQGSLIVSGFGAEGADGSRVTVNTPSAGRIPNGATVERSVPSPFDDEPRITLNLNAPDFTTAQRLAASINNTLGEGIASPVDAVSVDVRAPVSAAAKVEFLSILENLPVDTAAASAKVVVNSRSGTIVIGSDVRIKEAAVAHGNLTVRITEDYQVSQPGAFATGGQTVVTPGSEVDIEEEEARMFVLSPGVSLQELVDAVNQVGAAPGDVIAVLEALQQAGAMSAQLIVI